MTYDQIRTMPAGPELDRIAAEKVMGWRQAPDYLSAWDNGTRTVHKNGWDPSTNVAHAWDLIEHHIGSVIITKTDAMVSAVFVEVDKGESITDPWPRRFEASAETAALAITRAAILVKMEEKP